MAQAMKWVLAGSHQEYVEWSKDHLGPHTYIMSMTTIKGQQINMENVVFFGGYKRRSDYGSIVAYLSQCAQKQYDQTHGGKA